MKTDTPPDLYSPPATTAVRRVKRATIRIITYLNFGNYETKNIFI